MTSTATAVPAPKRGFFRTNIEAFTVAIVMALVIKQFAFEAFQVPTESMEPTIRGRTPGGDRIIVSKFAYTFSDPERWDVVVFRYPLSRLVNYVKRLVGLPGEVIRIAHGDIYVRREGAEGFEVARKPEAVQDALFLANPAIPAEVADRISFRTFWDVFERPQSGVDIDENAGTLRLDAGASERLVWTRPEFAITPERRDPDAKGRKGEKDRDVREPVSDLRFELRVTPESGAKSVVLVIQDGTQPMQKIRLELAVAGAGGSSRLLHGDQSVGGDTLPRVSVPAGEEARIVLENVDDRVRVLVDGDLVHTYDYIQAEAVPPGGVTKIAFGFGGGRGLVHRIGLWRDLYHTIYPGCPSEFRVPKDHFLFFGDNSANSLDARAFRVIGIRLHEDARVLLGDLEAVADDFDAPRQDNNPYLERDARGEFKDPGVHHFRDIQGNHWRLTPGSYDLLDLTRFPNDDGVTVLKLHQSTLAAPADDQIAIRDAGKELKDRFAHVPHAFERYSVLVHFVHRDAILGQANFVFLPGADSLLATLGELRKLRVIR